jgi:hypothetical protein
MRSIVVLAGAVLLPAAAIAAPQVKIPDCAALTLWAANAAPGQNFNPAPRLVLSKAFQDDVLVPVFGVPVLSWTQEDAQGVSQALVKCFQAAGQAHDQTSAGALANANRALGAVVPTNAAAQRARGDADAAKGQLDALPASPDLGRVLTAIVKGNPATPDMGVLRGLPREITDPSTRLMQAVLQLPDADRVALYKALDERNTAIEGKMTSDAEQAIAAAPQDGGGVITLMQVRADVAAISDDDTRARLRKGADDKADQIRATLRQAKPAVFVPPNCFDLYKWSSGPGAMAGIGIGGRTMMAAFTDDRVMPIFGASVADWTDEDVARLKTLRGVCQAASPRTIPGPGAPPEQGELMQLANRGRWIEGADQPIADARLAMQGYRKGREAMAADLAKLEALPATGTSMVALAQLASDPALALLTQDDRTQYGNALNAKRLAIAAQATDAAIKGLADVKLASLDDMKNLFAYVGKTLPTIPDPRGQQAFRDAFGQTLQQATARLVPELKAKLATAPATLSDVAGAEMTLVQLELAPPGVVNTPAYQTYFKAMQDSRDAMVGSARKKACAELASSVGAGSDASQDVWEGRDGVPLGDFLCEVAEHGTVNSYSGAGMFSSGSTLKVTPLKSQTFTISLHKVEVQPGKPMLVGYEIKDSSQASGSAPAAGQPGYSSTPNGPVTVEGWEIFVPNIIGLNGAEATECMKTIDAPSPDQLPAEAKVFWLHCWSYAEVQTHEIKLHEPRQ